MTAAGADPAALSVSPAPRGIARLTSTLLLTVTSALVAAAVHVALVEIRFRLLHRFTWTSREFPWFSPLAYLMYFGLLALPLALGGWLAPQLLTLRVRASIFAAMTLLAILLHFQTIHPWATLVFALGAGVRIGTLFAERPQHWLARSQRLSLTLAAMLAIYGLPIVVGPRIHEWRRGSAGPAVLPEKPNVILLILDTVRAANLSLYGYARPTTPNMERLALQGVTFETAFATSPWTAPTHATLVSGRFPSHTGVSYRTPMDDSFPTVAEAFDRAGYATGAFMANAGYAGRQAGMDRGFIRFEDYPVSFQQLVWSTTFTQSALGRQLVDAALERRWWKVRAALRRVDLRIVGESRADVFDAPAIADNFVEWRDRVIERPYFAMLNMLDAHLPYRTPFAGRFNKGRETIDRYDGAIAFQDSVVGSLVARLAQRGELERTILVILSDHGEQFGEHGRFGHGNSLYLPLLRVPLLIYAPSRVPAGLRDRRIVSLRDVPATLLELAGVQAPGIGGASLARAWGASTGSTSEISQALSEIEESQEQPLYFRNPDGAVKSLLDSAWHYLYNGNAIEEVYNWRADPDERRNLRDTAEGARVAANGRARIATLLDIEWPPTRRSSAPNARAPR